MKKFASPYGSTGRRNFVLLILFLFASVVMGRVVYLQVYHSDYLVEQGNSRFVRVKKEPAFRGIIKDRNGVPLAVSTPVNSVWVNPLELVGKPEDIKSLSEDVGLPFISLQSKIKAKADKNKSFLYIKRGLPPEVATRIKSKKLSGVYDVREYHRFYPSGDVTSQIIGFNNVDDEGQEGIELLFNDWLAGQAGSSEIIRDSSGKVVDILQEISPPVQGQDLDLTIDKRIQYLTYEALLETMEEHQAIAATAVVLDAKTSEILAMVSVPSGNPNNAQERKPSLLKNRAVTDTYEPGSVLKPLAIAAAINSGSVKSSTWINTKPGRLKVGRSTVRDVHNYGNLSVAGVIKKSSNVGTCKIALRTPRESIHSMYEALGFGQLSDIGFPGEQKGRFNSFKKLSDFEYCTNTYGYGISVTTLQLAQAYAVLANDGLKIKASLVKNNSNKTATRLMKKSVAKQIRKMLKMAVEKGGTGGRSTIGDYMEDYTVGGKTGTVHKVINGKYAAKRYRSVFVGMAPINNPKIVMAVMVDDPGGKSYYGGLVAAPVFSKVVGKALRIMNVAPDRKPKKKNKKKVIKVSH